jgi:hypothetical protein
VPRHEYKLEPTYGPKGGAKAPYVGTCSCGWAGPERSTEIRAAADWNNHEAKANNYVEHPRSSTSTKLACPTCGGGGKLFFGRDCPDCSETTTTFSAVEL